MTVALLGAIIVPVMIEPAGANPTDPVYALIYLTGGALVPWTAALPGRRSAQALQRAAGGHAGGRSARRAGSWLARREAKDEVTGDDVARVGGPVRRALAERCSAWTSATITDLPLAAMLHDVGKLHVPDRILLKPAAHAVGGGRSCGSTHLGPEILGRTAGFSLARAIARSHHENWDGSGYPDGLMGEASPSGARIVRLADVFDALSNRRPYKEPWSYRALPGQSSRGEPAGTSIRKLAPLFIALVESLGPAAMPVSATTAPGAATPSGGLVVVQPGSARGARRRWRPDRPFSRRSSATARA